MAQKAVHGYFMAHIKKSLTNNSKGGQLLYQDGFARLPGSLTPFSLRWLTCMAQIQKYGFLVACMRQILAEGNK